MNDVCRSLVLIRGETFNLLRTLLFSSVSLLNLSIYILQSTWGWQQASSSGLFISRRRRENSCDNNNWRKKKKKSGWVVFLFYWLTLFVAVLSTPFSNTFIQSAQVWEMFVCETESVKHESPQESWRLSLSECSWKWIVPQYPLSLHFW